jgi:Tol biopolymer transport system component
MGLSLVLAACNGASTGENVDTASTASSSSVPVGETSTTSTAVSSSSTGIPAPAYRLAFVRGGDSADDTDIYLVATDGTERILADSSALDDYPAWSSTGDRLAFDSYRTGNWDVFSVDADGSHLTQLTDSPGEDGFVDWAPDGNRIAFDSNRDGDFEIYVMELDSGQVTQITDNDANDGRPDFSPDGTRLVFESDRDGDGTFDLFVVGVDGQGLARLVDGGGSPAWSPDGNSVAFARENADSTDSDIYVVPSTGGTETQLTGPEGWDELPTWSGDGSLIYFGSDREGDMTIYTMHPDGSDITAVGVEGITYSPAPLP